MSKEHIDKSSVCPGCGRNEVHKLCPAWGTPYYMTGQFPQELQDSLGDDYTKMREVAFEAARKSGNSHIE